MASNSAGSVSSKPLSEPARGSGVAIALFFSIFLLAGLGFLIPSAILPVARVVQARSWTPTPCTILTSRVDSKSDESTTYRAAIRYRYTVAGTIHESDRSSPLTGYYGNGDAAELVRWHRPRSRATCYVNPSNPSEALLSRDLPWRSMLVSLFPLVFALVGAGGIYFTLRGGRQSEDRSNPYASVRPTSQTLRAKQGPVSKLLVVLCIALFWNGITSVLFYQVIASFRHGKGDLCMTIFSIPFVAVGIGLIVGVGYSFLALFNPRAQIVMNRLPLRPGETSDLKWRFSGRSDRISHLTIHLEGREEATYRRGTDTVTDKSIFFRQSIADTTKAYEISSGGGKIAIPPRAMHTFTARNNKIVWELQVHGEIAGWPDAKEQFEIVILPAEAKP